MGNCWQKEQSKRYRVVENPCYRYDDSIWKYAIEHIDDDGLTDEVAECDEKIAREVVAFLNGETCWHCACERVEQKDR